MNDNLVAINNFKLRETEDVETFFSEQGLNKVSFFRDGLLKETSIELKKELDLKWKLEFLTDKLNTDLEVKRSEWLRFI